MQSNDHTQEVWTAGSYAAQAPHYASMAGHLVERADVTADDEVLDVGTGTGNVAITAARRGADVTGVDITPEVLETAREHARAADVDGTDFREGDARDLPVETEAFDVTLSSLGHMYGDPPEATARELLRVTRPGGRIGFTSWTPTGLYPFMAGVVTTYLPPEALPEYDEPPFAWGDSDVVRERIGDDVADVAFETETVLYPALSPAAFWDEIARTSGHFVVALEAVDDEDRPALREELIETIQPYFDDRRNAVELEYLLTVATR